MGERVPETGSRPRRAALGAVSGGQVSIGADGSRPDTRRGEAIRITAGLQMSRVPVRIRAENGGVAGSGEVEYAKPSLGRRARKAGALILVGLGCGLLLLPIPLIHLFGVIFFLVMCALAARRLSSRNVLKSARGRCPSCNAVGTYFVGFGGRRLAFPIVTSCPRCHISLELEPATSGALFSEP